MRLLLLAILLAVNLFAQPDPGSDEHANGRVTQSPKKGENKSTDDQQASSDGSPRWYTPLQRPDWWVVIVAALTGLAIARQAGEMRKTTGLMQGQLTAMQGQLSQMTSSGEQTNALIQHAQAQVTALEKQNAAFLHLQRPWISVEAKLISPIIFDAQGMHLSIDVSVKNVGKMPAFAVIVLGDICILKRNQAGFQEQRDEMLEVAKSVTIEIGEVLFPGTPPAVSRWSLIHSEKDIREACSAETSDPQSGNVFFAAVVVSVAYKTGADEAKKFGTAVVYEMFNSGLPFVIGKNVPLEAVMFRVSALGGIRAD